MSDVETRPSAAAPIAGAFWFLTSRAARNRVRQQVAKLRSPRYVLAIALGALYFWGVFFRNDHRSGGAIAWGGFLLGDTAQVIASVLLVVTAARWWLFGGDRSALAFSPAEVQFLFPAPVTRRGLVHFKLLRAQMLVALNVVLWIALTRRGAPDVPLPLRALGFWAMFSTLHLHRLGAALVHASAGDSGRRGLWRHRVAIAVVLVAVAAVAVSAYRVLPDLRMAQEQGMLLLGIRAWLETRVPATVLWPARAVLALPYAASTAAWVRALPAALGLLALHYVWVLRADDAFEEAAAEASADRAARIAAIRGGGGLRGAAQAVAARREARSEGGALPDESRAKPRWRRWLSSGDDVERVRRPWFPLAATGRPEVAILWKNAVLVTRPLRWTTLWLVLGLVAVVAVVAQHSGNARVAGTTIMVMALTMTGFVTVFGPLWVRNDLRQDLRMLDLLRAWPLTGAAIVGAEIASSTLALVALQWTMAIATFIAAMYGAPASLGLGARTLMLAGAMVALPVLAVLGVTVQNAGALLFPEWVRLGSRSGGGVEAMGQNILTTAFTTLCTALALVAPLLAAVVTLGIVLAASGGLPTLDTVAVARAVVAAAGGLVAGVVVAIAVVALEVWLIVRWLGRVFERTDQPAST